jgi:predicted nucleic acid-binding protein
MNGRAFVDTNIFVYSETQPTLSKTFIAQDLVRSLLTSGRGIISYQVMHEFFNVALRKPEPKLSGDKCRLILDSVFRKLACVPSSPGLVVRSIDVMERYKLSWYDSLIVAAALESECRILYSEDFQAGQIFDGTLTVVNPFAAHKN